jgi:predicted transcriptional regulator
MPDDRALLVSVKPIYADLLLAGTKTVELRRSRPNVTPGCEVLLYASSPAMELVGRGRVRGVEALDLETLWARHGAAAAVSRDVFDAYFDGLERGVAISLGDVQRLGRRIPLAELRRRHTGFCPPQSFRYLAPKAVATLT